MAHEKHGARPYVLERRDVRERAARRISIALGSDEPSFERDRDTLGEARLLRSEVGERERRLASRLPIREERDADEREGHPHDERDARRTVRARRSDGARNHPIDCIRNACARIDPDVSQRIRPTSCRSATGGWERFRVDPERFPPRIDRAGSATERRRRQPRDWSHGMGGASCRRACAVFGRSPSSPRRSPCSRLLRGQTPRPSALAPSRRRGP